MDEDDQDYVFYGTPIEREEEISGRKRKIAADAGQMRSLPPWKQDVRDEEGRRRFHGAFTGGFSAGYYNTVGSKQGWSPQTFTSSRKKRAEVQEQNIYSFLDDDEKAELEGHALGTSLQFDTFGFTAAEISRKQAEKEQSQRPSAIPGPVPDEIVLPASNSIGVKLLLKMGWRHGHSIKATHADSLYDARREARKAFLAFSGNEAKLEPTQSQPTKFDSEDTVERIDDDDVYVSRSTPVFVLHPKQDLHGLGYDPFKHAPEFRERKIMLASEAKVPRHKKSMKESLFSSNSGKYAPGFGIGALEELDVEDEDVYASGFEFEDTHVEEVEEPSRVSKDSKQHLLKKEEGSLPGFRVASDSEYHLERFNPPVIPHDFEPHHSFPTLSEAENRFDESPPEVPPPEGNDLKMMIEGFAAFVARCGKLFEDLTKEKNRTNPLFCFLYGGIGHDYYARRLWEERRKRADQVKPLVNMNSASSKQKMTAESRGNILGEKALERSSNISSSSVASAHLQAILSDTFTKPASQIEFSEAAKPFKDDPKKQERFEEFLKDKYQGGLRSYAGGTGNMTESERARERVDFEMAAETIEKGQWKTKLFVSSTDPPKQQNKVHIEENIKHGTYPRREEYQWRPAPILCKRFDIADPFLGKPPPLPKVRSKMDSLIFISDAVEIKVETADASRNSISASKSVFVESNEQITQEETEIEPDNISLQRPVDLYKAIFSDDSEDEKENSSPNLVDPEKKATEGANTTLNRLIAGDFLESLGKELGLEVPPDSFYLKEKISVLNSQDDRILSEHDRASATDFTQKSSRVSAEDKVEISESKVSFHRITDEKLNKSAGHSIGNRFEYARPKVKTPIMSSKHEDGKFETGEMSPKEQRARKHSRRHRSRSDSSASSDSSDYGGRRDRLKAKEGKRGLHEEKSRDHSKHDIRKSKALASGSSKHDRRENRRSRDRKRDRKYH